MSRHGTSLPEGPSPGAGAGRRLLSGALAVLAIEGLGLALTLGIQVLLARWLGTGGFGLFAYATSWLLTLTVVAKGGAEIASLRFVAAYSTTGEAAQLRGFLVWSLRRTALGALALSAVTAAVAWALPGVAPSLLPVLWVACCALPVDSLLEVLVAVGKGLGRSPLAQAVAQVARRVLFGGLLLVAVWVGWGVSASGAMGLYLVSGAVALVALGALLRRIVPPAAETALAGETTALGGETQVWRSTTGTLFLFVLAVALIQRLDTLFLGMLRDTTEAGLYSVASRLAGLALLGQAAINSLLAPELSRLATLGEHRELERAAIRGSRLAAVWSLALGLGFDLVGPRLLGLFGPEFVAGQPALLILLGGALVNAACGSVGHLLNMTGHSATALRWALAALGLAALLHLLLIPPLGHLGAATATALATTFWNLALLRRVRALLGVRSAAWSWEGASRAAGRG
ncbi:MAG TPA: oligosaccharide flippase family protein [Thermoanaerobaculia bacterium]|nr:oligosaccharide flippase family protein [Thermoanaerobaculia bacterium]